MCLPHTNSPPLTHQANAIYFQMETIDATRGFRLFFIVLAFGRRRQFRPFRIDTHFSHLCNSNDKVVIAARQTITIIAFIASNANTRMCHAMPCNPFHIIELLIVGNANIAAGTHFNRFRSIENGICRWFRQFE